jgi:N-carbamoyl-L-amino-acid hydrolase
MKTVRIDADRLWGSIEAIAEIGPLPEGGSRRLALSEEDRLARDLFVLWCKEAGCRIEIDNYGNIFGVRPGRTEGEGIVLTGSHLDTQPEGGRFDGIYGVLAGLEVIRSLNDADIETDRPIAVVNWTNEEGVRFSPGLTGSKGFAGQLDPTAVANLRTAGGECFTDELSRIGYLGQESKLKIAAYIEAHIEQGPILEAAGVPVGLVIGVQGVRWYDLVVCGVNCHAGTTPMTSRADSFLAVAKIALALRAALVGIADDARFTIGRVEVDPGSVNTVPGETRISIDLRHPDADVLEKMEHIIREVSDQEAASEGCKGSIVRTFNLAPVKFNDILLNSIDLSAREHAIPTMPIVSGAMHDACALSTITPTAMIFTACRGGVSHNQSEWAEPAHLAAGAQVLLGALVRAATL